jgi:hypothetical protein
LERILVAFPSGKQWQAVPRRSRSFSGKTKANRALPRTLSDGAAFSRPGKGGAAIYFRVSSDTRCQTSSPVFHGEGKCSELDRLWIEFASFRETKVDAILFAQGLKSFFAFALTLSFILMSGGQGRLKPSPGNFFVASTPSLLPMAIWLVAWSSASVFIVAADVSRLILSSIGLK